MKPTIVLAALAATAAIPAASRAATAPDLSDSPRISVPMADLALGRSVGAGVALDRIGNAAGAVCGARPLPIELAQAQRRRACVQRATEDAIRDLGAPLVTARYYRTGPVRLLAAK